MSQLDRACKRALVLLDPDNAQAPQLTVATLVA